MNTHKHIYIAIDLHRNHSMIGYMNNKGKYMGQQQVQTSPENLINQITAIPAKTKSLTIEQSNMAFTMAKELRTYVDHLIVCDPRHNKLITQNANKNDGLDTQRLCRLLRLDELKPIWIPKQMGLRRLFYGQVKEYQRLIKLLTAQKNQFQANLRHWGITAQVGESDYQDPTALLADVSSPALAGELKAKLSFVRQVARQKDAQLNRIKQTGSHFWEIAEFQKMTGIGPIGAHTFSAYVQTPHRFSGRKQLIRFCQLGVCQRSSDGRSLGHEHLDKAGHSCLKQISYIAWETAQKSQNEVSGFYKASLPESNSPTNARLNTQRKILRTLWSLWKHKRTYRPELFYSGDGNFTC